MNIFSGFPRKTEFTALPDSFFSTLLPQIDDLAELKVTLYALAILYRKRGHPRFVSSSELMAQKALVLSLSGGSDTPVEETLRGALNRAVDRGTLIHLALKAKKGSEDIYLINTEAEREMAVRIQQGEIKLSGLQAAAPPPAATSPQPDIFTLYEQNIGMLTPMIAEELRAAADLYPPGWIEEAIREAVKHNKRKWYYIAAILETWDEEGRGIGAHKRDSKAPPDRYAKQKYGHMFQR